MNLLSPPKSSHSCRKKEMGNEWAMSGCHSPKAIGFVFDINTICNSVRSCAYIQHCHEHYPGSIPSRLRWHAGSFARAIRENLAAGGCLAFQLTHLLSLISCGQAHLRRYRMCGMNIECPGPALQDERQSRFP